MSQETNNAIQKQSQTRLPDAKVQIIDKSDPLYESVLEWVKEDKSMTIARVQLRLLLGYSRARQLLMLARRELGIDEVCEVAGTKGDGTAQ